MKKTILERVVFFKALRGLFIASSFFIKITCMSKYKIPQYLVVNM